jgi:quercetin dioxygenase-like cupin family protein
MTTPPNAISGDVQLAEHPAASAGVRRRAFLKGTAGLYLTALGDAVRALSLGPDPAKKKISKENTMQIKKAGSQPSTKGPAEWFTGTVRIDPLFTAPDPALVAGASVTFEPGARTAWHTHPLGQTLIVTSGAGLAQREGGPIEEIHPGDVIWFAPGEKHWHGAAPTTAMTHIAIQERKDGKMVDWMEHVSDEQYHKA